MNEMRARGVNGGEGRGAFAVFGGAIAPSHRDANRPERGVLTRLKYGMLQCQQRLILATLCFSVFLINVSLQNVHSFVYPRAADNSSDQYLSRSMWAAPDI